MNKDSSDLFNNTIPFIMEGQVIATDDPDQMGRVKVWVPALDGENFDVNSLPWTEYASPFFGFTVDYTAGAGTSKNKSHAGYGFWAIPKIGATVLVFCLNADPGKRFYFASTIRLHRNRTLPAGRNSDSNGKIGPFGDTGDKSGNLNPVQPAFDNLREQFQGKMEASQSKTRGVYERQIAQAKTDKDGKEGYSPNAIDPSYLDPQTVCFVTPGRHALIFQDDPRFARIRLKTAEGHQIIFDDANERIYISTAKGKNWIELDQDGHVHVFSTESISVRSGVDINLMADRNINLEANNSINLKCNDGDFKLHSGGSIHLKSAKSILQSACENMDFSADTSIHLTAASNIEQHAGESLIVTGSGKIDMKTGGTLIQKAAEIQSNSPEAQEAAKAACADKAGSPPIIPNHEPWIRPTSKTKRGPNWKE